MATVSFKFEHFDRTIVGKPRVNDLYTVTIKNVDSTLVKVPVNIEYTNTLN